MTTDRLYLDYNATSPLSASVQDWLKSGDVVFANPSSQHSAGKAARKVINESRTKIYSTFGKDEKSTKLFFHSGATEAFVTTAYSFSEMARKAQKKLLICYAKTDHPAVTTLAERYLGDHVEFHQLRLKPDLSYDHEGNFEELRAHGGMILYHHLWVHNETGLVSPLVELERFQQIPDLYIHVDAVQAPGKIPEWRELAYGDLWTFSAHKFGALKGIGFSFVRGALAFHPLFQGGGQQQGLRGGTENPQGVRSVALALNDLEKVDVAATQRKRDDLERFMEKELEGIGGVLKGKLRNSNTIYFFLTAVSSDIALALFDLNGLMLSAGSACSSGAARPSVILTELGLGEVAKNGLRLSLGFEVSEELLNRLRLRLATVFNKLKT